MKPEVTAIKAKRRRVAIYLGLFLFSIYLLIYRGGFHSVDEVSMFAVTESIAKFGCFNTDQIAWTQWTTTQAEAQGFFGTDGHVYSKKGLAFSLAQVPLYWLALNLPGLGMLQTVSLLNALLTAATALLIFMLLQRMNFSLLVAVLTSLVFGIVTIATIYAKYLFSEPLAGLLLLLAAYMLFAYRQEGGLRHIVIAGLAAGFAVLTRANNLFLLPVFGLYLLWIEKENINKLMIGEQPINNKLLTISSFVKASVVFVLALAIPGIILLTYNALRSGNPLQTGYDLTLFSPNVLTGFYKLLFSPLRGLFIYSPILLLSLPGWWLLRRTYPAEAWLFFGLTGVTIGLFSAWSSGEGLSWGSRFLVPVVPFFAVSLAPIIEQVAGGKVASDRVAGSKVASDIQNLSSSISYVLRFTFYTLLPLSLLIQFLGIVINPWVFLARLQREFGGEFFLEKTVALYDFRYTQIIGQLQTWSLKNSDLAWWQPWGFDSLAFGLSLALVIFSGWLLWRQPIINRFSTTTRNTQYVTRNSLANLSFPITILLFIAVTYFLLARYYQTDRQFGLPDDTYTKALNAIAAQVTTDEPIITVAQYHYHLPMNRFKARIPLIGFAQQVEPMPESALPLLSESASRQNIWLVTIGYPPAASDNATEHWLAFNTFKVSDEWLPNEVRVVRFSAAQPTVTHRLEINLGNEAELIKVRLLETTKPGQILPVEFVWQPYTQPKTNYNIFLQLLNAEGQLVAQYDGPPNGGYTPSSTWQKDQVVTSRHALNLPPQLSPGVYQLIAGLYDPATGERLSTDSGADFVNLGSITITEDIADLKISER